MKVSAGTTGSAWFLDGMASLDVRLERVQKQLSSGFRVHDASDAPLETPALIHLAAGLGQATVWRGTLEEVSAEARTAADAIGHGIDALHAARTLAVQGLNATATAAERRNLSSQASGLLQQLVAVANTDFGGRFIFGGDQDTKAPYALNPASATGVDRVTAQEATRVISSPSGEPVYQSTTALRIFDDTASDGSPGTRNAFRALQELFAGLAANDTNRISVALDSLTVAADWLNLQQARYGLDARRLDTERESNENDIVSLQAQISSIRDADMVEAATELSNVTTAQQAAFAAQGRIQRRSLFEYLA